MGKEVVLFSSEEHMDVQRVSDFLHQLADKVASGEVILSRGNDEVTLHIPKNVVLEVKAEEEDKGKRTERSLEVEIEWVEGADEGSLTLG